MAEDKKIETNEDGQKQIGLNAQYLKDSSFESPKAPASIFNTKERPNIDVNLDVKAQPVGENMFEAALVINATAKNAEEEIIFIAEVTYAGVFTLINVPDEEKEPALLIYCPNLIFPFARRIISDLTRDGGFPPLMLDPIDFAGLYAQRKSGENAGSEKTNAKGKKKDVKKEAMN